MALVVHFRPGPAFGGFDLVLINRWFDGTRRPFQSTPIGELENLPGRPRLAGRVLPSSSRVVSCNRERHAAAASSFRVFKDRAYLTPQ